MGNHVFLWPTMISLPKKAMTQWSYANAASTSFQHAAKKSNIAKILQKFAYITKKRSLFTMKLTNERFIDVFESGYTFEHTFRQWLSRVAIFLST